ncbi:unnamed protein product [Rhizophagus irregularis]|nr:unnamed protein product [Rhizophagus irregularis]
MGKERPRRSQEKEKDDKYVEPSLSRKILKIAKEQQEELQEELEEEDTLDKGQPNKNDQNKIFSSIIESESEEDYSDEEDFDYEELEIDEKDQEILKKFLPNAPRERKTLADLIMEKIESQNLIKDKLQVNVTSQHPSINPKVVEVYTKVGTLLRRYKSGKLPKAFKLFHLCPIGKKFSLYKPAAFFKGILFPLCESGTCTLKEAAIIGSIISKVSIPILHSSAGLLRLAEMEYSGPNSLFIRILLDKKYALPYKVVDALVFHFLQFKNDERTMPVLWHQSFLVFAQRYNKI